jgi:predicted transcriptional regulator YdeE
MMPHLVTLPAELVIGVDTVTTNAAEADPATARIPALWARFFGEGVLGRIPGKKEPAVPVGAYTDYESDHRGRYRLLAGAAVEEATPVPDGLASARRLGGRYLVFAGEGEMPGVVIETWKAVWDHFAEPGEHVRAFTTDFEAYRGPRAVEIFIAIR